MSIYQYASSHSLPLFSTLCSSYSRRLNAFFILSSSAHGMDTTHKIAHQCVLQTIRFWPLLVCLKRFENERESQKMKSEREIPNQLIRFTWKSDTLDRFFGSTNRLSSVVGERGTELVEICLDCYWVLNGYDDFLKPRLCVQFNFLFEFILLYSCRLLFKPIKLYVYVRFKELRERPCTRSRAHTDRNE